MRVRVLVRVCGCLCVWLCELETQTFVWAEMNVDQKATITSVQLGLWFREILAFICVYRPSMTQILMKIGTG